MSAAGARALELLVALVHLRLCCVAQRLHAVLPVERAADLLVGLHEALQFTVQVFVLAAEHAAVVVQGVDFFAQVAVAALQALVGEAQVVLLAAGHGQVLVDGARLSLEAVQVAGQVAVAGQFVFGAVDQVVLLVHLEVEGAREVALLVVQAGELVAGGAEVVLGVVEGLAGAAQVVLAHVGDLGKFSGALLHLEEVVVGSLNARVGFGVLTLLEAVEVAEAVDFELVAGALLLELLELVASAVVVFAELVAVVGLLLHVALARENFSFPAGDLLAKGGNLAGAVVVGSVLLIEEEAGVFGLLLESLEADEVAVVAGLEVVVLEQLLVLQVSVLGLDRVELVPQSEVVLVALLDLEDLRLQLRNQQVLLVRGQVHRVVVLHG